MISSFTTRLRTALTAALLTGLAAHSSLAQSQMRANKVEDAPTYNTTNSQLAVDESTNTFATLSPWLVGGAAVRVDFPVAVASGQRVTLLLRAGNGGLLTASVLSKMIIRTFLSSNNQPNQEVQTVRLDDLGVNVALLPGSADVNQVTFTVKQLADQVQLQSDALVTAGTTAVVDLYAVFGTITPLPVQLTAFAGKATAAGVALSWTTAAEQQNDYFVVERADDALNTFRALGQVRGAGTCSQSQRYQFTDAAPGGLRYYRLRQVGLDGTASYGPIVAVQTTSLGLGAYPSPAAGVLIITAAAGTHLGIFNQLGQQVQTADMAAAQTQELDVSALPSGVYYLRDAATGQSTRFLKGSR